MLGENRVRVEGHIAISEEIRLFLKLIRSIEEIIDLFFFIQFNERVKYSIKEIEKVPFLKQAIISEVLRIPKQFNNTKMLTCWHIWRGSSICVPGHSSSTARPQ